MRRAVTAWMLLVSAVVFAGEGRWSDWLDLDPDGAPDVIARVRCDDHVYLVELGNGGTWFVDLTLNVNGEPYEELSLGPGDHSGTFPVLYAAGCRDRSIDVTVSDVSFRPAPEGYRSRVAREIPRFCEGPVDIVGGYTILRENSGVTKEERCDIEREAWGTTLTDRVTIECIGEVSAKHACWECVARCRNRGGAVAECHEGCRERSESWEGCCDGVEGIEVSPTGMSAPLQVCQFGPDPA